jgi:hypothetical protein
MTAHTITEIGHLYAIYARALDERRLALLGQVFAPDAALDYVVGPYRFACSGAEAAAHFDRFLTLCYWTSHVIGAPMVELTGDGARASARVTATHLQRLPEGTLNRWIVRGSYHDRLGHTPAGWRITARTCICPDVEGDFLEDGVEEFTDVTWADPGVLG